MARIFHLITKQDWETAQDVREWRPGSLADEGFVHCSNGEEQLVRVARRLYSGRDDMLALEVDTEKLHYPVITEASRSGELYPHIYGPLELDAVVAVWSVNPDGEGSFSLSAQ